MTKVFVSYSRRDGVLTDAMLRNFQHYLSEICQPFIHALDTSKPKFPQLLVMRKLLQSNAIFLLETPKVQQSPWVKLELLVGKIALLSIIRIPAERLLNTDLHPIQPFNSRRDKIDTA